MLAFPALCVCVVGLIVSHYVIRALRGFGVL